jgi:glycosyltransferase involved in cell wall biosynthesis
MNIPVPRKEFEKAACQLIGKKICIVTNQYFDEWTGVARSARRLVSYLINAGAEVHIVTPLSERKVIESNGGIHHKLAIDNPALGPFGELIYKVHLGNSSGEMNELHEFLMLLDFKESFNCFHGFWLPYAYGCLIVASNGDRPVIASIRGNDAVAGLGQVKRMPFIQAVLKKARFITSVSSDLLENVSIFEDLNERSCVIENGIDESRFVKWNQNEVNRGRVGTLGELRYKKGIPFLVDAFALSRSAAKKDLILAGDFSDEAEEKIVTQHILNNGLQERVQLIGQVKSNKVNAFLNSLNVFVISSIHDGFPNTLLEACACGIPIIATNVGGMKDVMKDGENCLLVKPGDVIDLSKAISRILDDDVLALKLSNGAKEISKKFSLERERDNWINLYLQMLEIGNEN